jgi:hypothetical protein
MPRIVCSAATTGSQCPVRQHHLDLRRQPIAPYLGNIDRRDVIFQHDVMDRLVELEPRQPAAMQLGPGRPAIVAPLAQQKSGELLARPAQAVNRIEPRPHQIAHRLVLGIWNPHRRQLACTVEFCQTGGISPVGLDPVTCPFWDQRGSDHDAFLSAGRQSTLNAITARSRLVAKPQDPAVDAELVLQPVQRRRRVRDPAVFPHLTPQAARRYRNDNAFLVNVQSNVSDTVRHDPSPMHEARHRSSGAILVTCIL